MDKIGTSHARIEGPAKVTGQARYAADYAAPGLLHAVMVSSTIARGRITWIDASLAHAVPGVLEVFTHENRPDAASVGLRYKDMVGPPGTPFRPLHDERILFNDQPIALVVADTYERARDAAALVEVSYLPDEFDTDLHHAATKDHDPHGKRFGISGPPEPRGDAPGALAGSPVHIDAEYRTVPQFHNPMELFATTAVWNSDGTLTVYDKTQSPQSVHLYLRMTLRMRLKDIRVINEHVGGGFGAALRPAHSAFLAALAARHLQRPVRVVMTRAQMFATTYRPHALQRVRLGAGEDGRLRAVLHEAVAATSTYEEQQEVVVNWSGLAYACDNVTLDYRLAPLSTPTPGDMRAPGAVTGQFALECAMDELAAATRMDPVALRLANYVEHDQNEDLPITSKALRECYAQGAELFGWGARSEAPRSMREGHELIGWGMAGGTWDAMMAPMPARVRATLHENGRVEIACAASDIGTGTRTILAQIAADTLNVSMEQIDVRLGDSSLPLQPVEGGSWMAATTGAAVAKACKRLQARRKRHRKAGPLVVTYTLLPDVMGKRKHVSYTHSAIFAEVRIDESLGVIRVTRLVAAVAAGRILNPLTARSQILGGLVMGIGGALHEEGQVDHRYGRVMNHSLADYHIPTHADVPDLEVIFVEEHDAEVSPLGIKGVGEIGIVGVAPAIANAVFHATGVRVRELPITLDKLIA